MKLTIAFDGPAGAGKSTVARLVSKRLGYRYIDTGAMYRAITLKAINTLENIEDDIDGLIDLTKETLISFDEDGRVYLDGNDVSDAIRSPEVGNWVSIVARVREVREVLVGIQRELASGGGVVVDGRDIGTVVLPDADLKIFLTASLEERACRRFNELCEKGFQVSKEAIKEEIEKRDKIDSQREVGPLTVATDALVIDTTHLSIEDVVERVISACKKSCSYGK